MNELLQRHGCANVFTVPEGLKELMADITREVLRAQPKKMYEFIANYLSVLIITREHGIMAVKILDDLCDCKPTVSQHFMQLGITHHEADVMAQIVDDEIKAVEPAMGREKVRETQILKKILARAPMDEETSAKVCQVVRNAYKDYWYRRNMLIKHLSKEPEENWEIAAQHTLELYKKTKPSLEEMSRATERIQAAYKGYHTRRNILRNMKKLQGPKVDLPGPPIDVAGSREIFLGYVIDIQVKEDDMGSMFETHAGDRLGLRYDTNRMLTHVQSARFCDEEKRVKPFPSKARSVTGFMAHQQSLAFNVEALTLPDFERKEMTLDQDTEGPKNVTLDPDNVTAIEISRTPSPRSPVSPQRENMTKISFSSKILEIINTPDSPMSTLSPFQISEDNIQVVKEAQDVDDSIMTSSDGILSRLSTGPSSPVADNVNNQE